MQIREMRTRQREVDAEMRRLDRFEELTEPQSVNYQSLREETIRLSRDILNDAVRTGAYTVENGTPTGDDHSGSRPAGADLRSRALNAVERSSKDYGVADHASERVTVALERDTDPESRLAKYVLETSDPEYFRAFSAWFNDPVSGHREWTGPEVDAHRRVKALARTMNIGTPGSGGFLVPFALDPQINISNTGSIDPMRQVSSVRLTAVIEQRFITSTGVVSSWDAEEAEVSDDSPTLLEPVITSFKGQGFIPVSLELYEDSNLASQVSNLFADSKTQLEANAFTLGTGTGQPKGAITAVSAVGTSVVASALTGLAIADIVANQNALPPRWRTNAKFMANLTMINAARQIPMYANGPSIVNDATTPPRCFGWELRENSTMDGTIGAGTTNDYVWLGGDFSQYQITDRIGSMIELVPTLMGPNRRPSGQRGFYMHWRTGGDVLIPDAFRLTNYSG
jgi:HK97 family phage major capsid protein